MVGDNLRPKMMSQSCDCNIVVVMVGLSSEHLSFWSVCADHTGYLKVNMFCVCAMLNGSVFPVSLQPTFVTGSSTSANFDFSPNPNKKLGVGCFLLRAVCCVSVCVRV